MFRSLFTRWKWLSALPVGQTALMCTTSCSSWCLKDAHRCQQVLSQSSVCTALWIRGTGTAKYVIACVTLDTKGCMCVSQSAAGSPCTLIYWNKGWRRKDDTEPQQNDETCQPASGELLTWAVYLDLMGTCAISVLSVSQQRNVCSPSGLLSCHLTAHFLKVRVTALNLK